MMLFSHNPWLLVLSFLVSFAGCYAVLHLLSGLNRIDIHKLRLYLSITALILGASVWAAHFISMLAMHFPTPVTYEIQKTLISGLLAVALSGVSIYLISVKFKSFKQIVIGGTVFGLSAILMHFIGMNAFQSHHYDIIYHPAWVVASLIFAIVISIGALSFCINNNNHQKSIINAGLLAIAVCSVHHFSMLSSSFITTETQIAATVPVIPSHTLAIYISLVVFALITTALLTLVKPEHKQQDESHSDMTSLSNGSASQSDHEEKPDIALQNQFLPIERNNKTEFLNLHDILYVQADAHYSKVYSQDDAYFCNISITTLEERLPKDQFLRVHRSFIANMMNIKGFNKKSDKASLLFDRSQDNSIPVSRQRLKEVQKALSI